MWRPPLAKGSLGGILPGIFEKYFRLTRRDPAKSIFETSRFLSFFKNLGFSKMWDPEIWQSAREGKKWRPLGYYDYTVKLSIPAHLIFSILKKRAREWRPFLWEDSLGGKCAFPDTQISQSARGAPKVAPLWRRDIWGEYRPAFLRNIFSSRDGTQPNRLLRPF